MKLAAPSHEHLENFLREFYQDSTLRLPIIRFHGGALARLVTRALRIGAITFGRHVLISPELIKTDSSGRRSAPGWLVAHEAVHVLQYEREGYARFLMHYLMGYWRALRESGKWGREARMNAYLSIAEERAAQEVERAYQARGRETKP
ncbi:MAG TPA: DUF4157 domain-containing protein [Pyrinomonadaceae bacterium]|nr:DUF4157 domain-containing protein [Pyrinomonadaceae bacterium]